MNRAEIIRKTKKYIMKSMENGEPGHDWHHVERVWKMARRICRKERGDMFIVELAALLHDVADWKFHGEGAGEKKARQWLGRIGVEEKVIGDVIHVIENISFKGSAEKEKMRTLEGKIVQDADRLDALGAIGLARCFTFTGYAKRPIHDPETKPKMYMNFSQYRKNRSTAINHFYEKLLLLKDRMHTKTGRKLAEERHRFMLKYLDRFFKEWDGK